MPQLIIALLRGLLGAGGDSVSCPVPCSSCLTLPLMQHICLCSFCWAFSACLGPDKRPWARCQLQVLSVRDGKERKDTWHIQMLQGCKTQRVTAAGFWFQMGVRWTLWAIFVCERRTSHHSNDIPVMGFDNKRHISYGIQVLSTKHSPQQTHYVWSRKTCDSYKNCQTVQTIFLCFKKITSSAKWYLKGKWNVLSYC